MKKPCSSCGFSRTVGEVCWVAECPNPCADLNAEAMEKLVHLDEAQRQERARFQQMFPFHYAVFLDAEKDWNTTMALLQRVSCADEKHAEQYALEAADALVMTARRWAHAKALYAHFKERDPFVGTIILDPIPEQPAESDHGKRR